MPSTRPLSTFDDEGVCDACRTTEAKKKVDWKVKKKSLNRYWISTETKRALITIVLSP